MSKSKQNKPTSDKATTRPKAQSAAATSRREQLRAQQAADAARARTRRILTAVAAAVAFIIVAVVVIVLVQNHQRNQALQEQHGTGQQIVPVTANDDKSGIVYDQGTAPVDAPIVSAYLDFQCGGCAQASQLIDPKLESLARAGEITLVYHMLYGLDAAPNGLSFRANVAASCAANYGSFADYAQQVFGQVLNNQQAWNDDLLRNQFATASGLAGDDLAAFQSCFDNKATSDFVQDAQSKKPAIITQTPSFLVNGKLTDLASASASEQTLLAAIKAAA